MSTSFAIKTQSLNFGSSFKTNFYHYSSTDNIKMKDAEICFVNLLLEIYDENTSKIIFIDDVNLPTIKEKVQKFLMKTAELLVIEEKPSKILLKG